MASQIKFRAWNATVGGVATQIWVPSSAVPDSIGGGGGGSIKLMYVTADNGPTIICTPIPPSDYTLSAAAVNGGSGGTGYVVGQILTIAGGTVDANVTNNVATIKVTSIGAGGTVTGVAINNAGAYTAAPANAQTINAGAGTGGSFLVPFNPPIAVAVNKPPDLSTALTGVYYQGVQYTFAYTASAATDAGHPAGSPGMVYYTRTINGSDGSTETDSIDPPYLWGGKVLVGTLTDGSLMDMTPGRGWCEI